MTDVVGYFQEPRILVPVDLSGPDWDQLEPVELLSSLDVVLLGLYQITDQVSPEQARDEFEEEARERLQTLSKRFEQTGVRVESMLVFCVDPSEAINRAVDEKNFDAVLTWNEKRDFSSIGVFLRGDGESDHLMDSVASFMADQDQSITLLHFVRADEEASESERRAHLEQAREYLVDRGLERNRIDLLVKTVEDVNEAMIEYVNQYDAIVMGETEPTVASKIFGARSELVREHTEGPILIVRRPRS